MVTIQTLDNNWEVCIMNRIMSSFNNGKIMFFRLFVVFVSFVVFLSPIEVKAQTMPTMNSAEYPCPEDVAASISQRGNISQQRARMSVEPLAKMWMSDRDETLYDAISACVSFSWSGGFSFSLPTFEIILENIIRAIVRRICQEARDAVRSVESIFGGRSYYINSPIPGMGRIGGGWGWHW
jgi:hypothetical protein